MNTLNSERDVADHRPAKTLADRRDPSVRLSEFERIVVKESDDESKTADPKSEWVGFSLEHRQIQLLGVHQGSSLNYQVLLQLSGEDEIEVRHQGQFRKLGLTAGRMTLVNAGQSLEVRAPGSAEFLAISLTPQFVRWAANDLVPSAGQLSLRHLECVEDSLMKGIILALWSEAKEGYKGGRTYGESLGAALAVHLVRRYSRQSSASGSVRSSRKIELGLGRSVLQESLNYIEAHVAQKPTLQAIATHVGLSANHFARRFKLSTGQAPHQYILHRQVDLARAKLTQSRASVAEIASELGFWDQSHLTHHFRRVMGVTPFAYRQRMKKISGAG